MSMKRKTNLKDFEIRGGKEWKLEEKKNYLLRDLIDEIYDCNSCDRAQDVFNINGSNSAVMQPDPYCNQYYSNSLSLSNQLEAGNVNNRDDDSTLLFSSNFDSSDTVVSDDTPDYYLNITDNIDEICNNIIGDSNVEQFENIQPVCNTVQNACTKQIIPNYSNTTILKDLRNLENLVPNFRVEMSTCSVSANNTFISSNDLANGRVCNGIQSNNVDTTKAVNQCRNNQRVDGAVPFNVSSGSANECYYNSVADSINNVIPDTNMPNSYFNESTTSAVQTIPNETRTIRSENLFLFKGTKSNLISFSKVKPNSNTELNESLINRKEISAKRAPIVSPKGNFNSQFLFTSENGHFNNRLQHSSSNSVSSVRSTVSRPLIRLSDFIIESNNNNNNKSQQQFVIDSKFKAVRLRVNDRKVDKSIQTVVKANSVKTKSVGTVTVGLDDQSYTNEVNSFNHVRLNVQEVNNIEKIKRLQLFNGVFLFTFTVNTRCLPSYDYPRPEDFVNNNEKIEYYTGIPQYSYFMALLNCLDLPKNNVVAPFQMLLLTLIKIRLNLDWIDLGFRFGRNSEIAKDTFGLTVSVLVRCLSKIINWPLNSIGNYTRECMRFYIYGIDIRYSNKSIREMSNDRILLCLSNARHPVHFVSKPVTGKLILNKNELLRKSGIISSLVHNDIVLFDNDIPLYKETVYSKCKPDCCLMQFPLDSINHCCLSNSGIGMKNVYQVNSVDKSDILLVSRPCAANDKLVSQIDDLQRTVTEISKFKFLNDAVSCDWLMNSGNENGLSLFYDVVTVVSGIVNLCNILPFSKHAVKTIINERKSMRILVK